VIQASQPVIEPGVHDQIPAELYHKAKGWSQSQLKLLPKHPELFEGYYISKRWEFEATAEMHLGTILHGHVLERRQIPEIPRDALSASGQRRGKAWDAWCAANNPDDYLTVKDAARVEQMARGLWADPKCASILSAEGRVEQSYAWVDPETGLPLRARLDKVISYNGLTLITDLKTTTVDVTNQRQVGNKVFELAYYRQAAMYCDAVMACEGIVAAGFGFLFVRTKEPFNARFWDLGAEDIAMGRRRNREALMDLARRLDTGDWSGPLAGLENQIILPRYAYDDTQTEDYGAVFEEFTTFTGAGDQT
jgi:hypothetical protein